jgi:hypothetical protein
MNDDIRTETIRKFQNQGTVLLKRTFKLLLLPTLFLFHGCDWEDVEDTVKEAIDDLKEKYEEYRGEGEQDKPKPFTVVYQANPNDRQVLISASCGANGTPAYVYYPTPADTVHVLGDTYHYISYPGRQKPYWDIRYIAPVEAYIRNGTNLNAPDHSVYTGLDARSGINNIEVGTAAARNDAGGSVTQSVCIDNQLAGGVLINLNDAYEQSIYYGGPQSTLTYKIGNTPLASPWKPDGTGNLVLQASFNRPLYINYAQNEGGGVYFGLFLKNRRTGHVLNYVIALYATGDAWVKEKRGIQFDPTTGFVHVATVVSDKSWWSTKSPSSMEITPFVATNNTQRTAKHQWPDFFRVNVEYKNLKALLEELRKNPPAGAEGRDFGLDPSEWTITAVMLQYELEENGGKATMAGSFRGFEAYITKLPI